MKVSKFSKELDFPRAVGPPGLPGRFTVSKVNVTYYV